MEYQANKPSMLSRLKHFYENSKHVLSISYKPSMSDFKKTAKIVLYGTLAIGILGYIISLIVSLII
ncbi:MAG: protein translocase SEC61 complex subunit gamma [Candidatus Micrarchaeota archaeon]